MNSTPSRKDKSHLQNSRHYHQTQNQTTKQIRLVTLKQETIMLAIPLNITLKDLHELVEKATKIPSKHQVLQCNGKYITRNTCITKIISPIRANIY